MDKSFTLGKALYFNFSHLYDKSNISTNILVLHLINIDNENCLGKWKEGVIKF